MPPHASNPPPAWDLLRETRHEKTKGQPKANVVRYLETFAKPGACTCEMQACPCNLILPITTNILASVSITHKRLEKLDPSDDEYLPLFRELLNHPDLRLHIQGLHGSALEGFVDLLDEVSKAAIDIR